MGAHSFENFTAAVLNLTHVDKALGRRLDGLIGINVLRANRFTIDMEAGRLTLGTARPKTPPVQLKLEQGGVFMPMRIGGLNFRMNLDTGTSHTNLASADFARVVASGVVPLSARVAGSVDVNGFTANQTARVVLVECAAGSLTRENMLVREGDSNLLGMDFFKDRIITFDGTTGQLWIEASR